MPDETPKTGTESGDTEAHLRREPAEDVEAHKKMHDLADDVEGHLLNREPTDKKIF